MTDIAKTIEVIFSGVDSVSAIAETVGGKIEGISSSIKEVAKPFADATEAVVKFEAALAAMTAAGLIVAFNASKNFESATKELQKVLGDSETTDRAEEKAISLSNTYGESSIKILESMANFKQSGFDLSESMDLAKTSMDLVIAGGLSANDASSLLVATLKGFNVEAEDANRLMDILNETSNNYATDVEQLANGMARVSPVASQMGFSMEETAGLLTPIIEVFRSGDEAADALRTGLLKLTDDSKPVTEALSQMGISQRDINGDFKSGKEIFYEVAEAMQNMDENQRMFLISQLVGIEQAPKMSLLFSDLGKVTDIMATAMNSAGSAAKEVTTQLDSSEVAVNRFQTAFTNLSKEIGDEFRDSAKGAIEGTTDIENALRGIVDAGTFDSVLSSISNMGDNIGQLLSSIAKNLPEAMGDIDFDKLLSSFSDLKEAFSDLFDGIDLTTPEGLADVIQTIIDTVAGMQEVFTGLVEVMEPVTDFISSMITKFSELSSSTQQLIGNILAVGTAFSGLAAVLATGGALVAGIGALGALLTGPAGIVVGLGALSAAVITAIGAVSNWSSGNMTKDLDESTAALNKQSDEVEKLLDQLKDVAWDDPKRVQIEAAIDTGNYDEAQKLIDEALAEEKKLKIKAEVEQKEFDDYWAALVALPPETQTKILVEHGDAVHDIESLKAVLKEIEGEKKAEVKATVAGGEDIKAALTDAQKLESIDGIKINTAVEYQQLTDFKKLVNDTASEANIDITAKVSDDEFESFKQELLQSKDLTAIEVSIVKNAKSFTDLQSDLDALIATKQVGIKADPDFKGATEAIEIWTEDHGTITIEVPVDKTKIEEAKKKVEEIPTEKQLEITLKGDIDKELASIKANAETMQSAMEWTAKIDIAQAEAAASTAKAAFESIGTSVTSVTENIGSMFGEMITGLMSGDLSTIEESKLFTYLDSQQESQDKLIDAQTELAKKQSEYYSQKTEALKKGESLITITSDGLEPALEMVMWEVIKKVQIRATEEAADFLLGVDA